MEVYEIKSEESLVLSDNIVIYKQNDENRTENNIENLQKVSILTRDTWPFFDDIALALFLTDIIFVLPSENASYQKMYDALSGTLQLNYKKVIEAMSCAENAEFIIWEK